MLILFQVCFNIIRDIMLTNTILKPQFNKLSYIIKSVYMTTIRQHYKLKKFNNKIIKYITLIFKIKLNLI